MKMPEMETKRVKLEYPLNHVKEPILYHLVSDYNLVPNIRRANVDIKTGGTLILQLQGAAGDLQAGMEFLRGVGIQVSEIQAESAW
jgi:ABC-type methionine transport system ATPase subunit